MGDKGRRTNVGRLESSIPRYDGVVAAQPEIHADVCRSLDSNGDCASASCTIAVVPPHRLA